jgi:hypothetical protein
VKWNALGMTRAVSRHAPKTQQRGLTTHVEW